MPSVPIPISLDHSTPTAQTYGMTSNSPSSSISISPQTPFFPPPGMANHMGSPRDIPGSLNPSSPPGAQSGFFKWAAASLGKSPPVHAQKGFDIPNTNGQHNDEEHHEHHDSFEFGDFDDLKSRSWTKQRRAVSMSGPSGITSMLTGFGATSPPTTSTSVPPRDLGNGPGGGAGSTPMSVPSNSVLAENAARGQGVLRRLSMSGSSFRPGFLSPNSATTTLPSPPAIQAQLPPQPAAVEQLKADAGVQRAATVSGARGRRYSDSGKKRGVSPMGERILRDHGHF